MNDRSGKPDSKDERKALEEMERPDGQAAPDEAPATQGLKTPPRIELGEDSGEWTRGGGSDPNEIRKKP